MKKLIAFCDRPNKNGRTYPRDVLHHLVGKTVYGHVGFLSETHHLNLESISHTVTDIHFEEDCLFGEVNILKTPMGILLTEVGDFDLVPTSNGFVSDGVVTNTKFISIDAIPSGQSAFQLESVL